jgi:hypothetical protein
LVWPAHDGGADSQLMLFFNEAWFSLCGEVNSQNSQHWSAGNSRLTIFLFMMKKITDCYSNRDAANLGMASCLRSCCFMDRQEEILPVLTAFKLP